MIRTSREPAVSGIASRAGRRWPAAVLLAAVLIATQAVAQDAEAPGAPMAPAIAPAATPSPDAAPRIVSPAAPTMPASPTAAPPAPPPAPQVSVAPPAGSEPAANVAAATLPHDLSPWGMFMAADIVVKAVMAGLAFASLVTWTIWLAKAMELRLARSRARRAVRRLEDAASLSEIASSAKGSTWPRRGPVAALVAAAEGEVLRSAGMPVEGVKERTQVALQRIEARAGRSMARGTGLLATIGSTAPFVGLFGTVWGIMNAFIGISEANTTNLAVVAPGIAEALLATAIGLVAAIPAVIVYNVFARSIAGYRALLADASAEVLRHLSRDLDRREAMHRGAAGRLRAAE